MNITSQSFALPIQTAVNLPTDSLRRENQQREVITKTEALSQSAAEKGVASDKDRGRTPAQNNEQFDFANLRKQAENANDSIGDSSEGNSNSSQDSSNQNSDTSSEASNDNDGLNNSNKTDSEVLAEQQKIEELKRRDQEVRTHELAHARVGGPYTGSPNYTFEEGPDGKRYAVEGNVSVDSSPIEGDPEATIAKLQQVHAAALAPANPSSQDIRVAASATRAIAQARSELAATEPEDASIRENIASIESNEIIAEDSNESAGIFDQEIAQTLSEQESITATRSSAINERAARIQAFYVSINQAYEKPPSNQFELTA